MFAKRLLDLVLGKPIATDEEGEQRIGVWQGVPMLGLDALGSAAYGPEAALTILLPLGALGLSYIIPIIAVVVAVLVVLYFSYRQTISAYPNGGGSYTVARENLGEKFGLLAAAALLLDYLLNVAVGIAAGVGALVSAVPALHGHIVVLCLAILALITLVNLRGARESGAAWALPTYLFIVSLLGVVGFGIAKTIAGHGHPAPLVPPLSLRTAATGAGLYLLLRAFASGCTAMTGVEAVSNGVTAFEEPRAKRAEQTLTVIVAVLAVLLVGIAFLTRAYHIGAMEQEKAGYQSVISQVVEAVAGRGVLYYVTIASVLAVLCLSANTSFAGFPRLCQLLADDDYLPVSFANKGRRLVYTTGILILAALSAIVLLAFGGITDRLIPLFAVGAFLAFTLSQAGMVGHWRRQMKEENGKEGGTGGKSAGGKARASLAINGVGCAATAGALGVILVAKFTEGAWITVLIIPSLLLLFLGVKRHYAHIADNTRCARPIDLKTPLTPPLLVVPIRGWNSVTEKALRFGLTLSQEIIAVHIATSEDEEKTVRDEWVRHVEDPLRKAGLAVPRLVVIQSPYRRLFTPFLRFIHRQEIENPERPIGVLVPELIESKWWYYPLHNQRATALKAALLFGGHSRVAVINVPWYLNK